MSDDEKKPGATLTIKPRAARKEDEASPRQRSGARARRVEQLARQQGELPAKPTRTRARAAGDAPASAPARNRDRQGTPETAPQRERGRQDGAAQRRGPREDGFGKQGGAEGRPRPQRRDGAPRQDGQRPYAPRDERAGPAEARGNRQRSDAGRSGSPRSADARDRPRRPAAQPHSPQREYDGGRPRPAAGAQRSARPAAHEIVGQDGVFQVFTPCPQGLEAALAEELQALGYTTASAVRAGCHLSTDWPGVQRINLYSRLATRVLVKVSSAPVQNEDEILELARATPWERWFGPEHSLRVDTSAVRSPMKSLQYCNLRAKDGICDRLREREGARPDIDTVRPDARVHLFLDERTATLYLDTSGESLFKRGWRFDKGEAPIRENLAAGMLALSGWQPGQALLDPFCGSGTILIEAAWKALGMPPGIMRPFAFERLRHHDRQAWYAYKDQIRAEARTELDAPIVGVDLNPASLEAARLNAKRAGLGEGLIRFETGDACEVMPPAPSGWIVTNPPYGERLPADDAELWPRWASHLKRHYSGWQVHAISNDLQLPQRMRLQARRRHPLHNGALDCRLFSFDMVAERYDG